MANNESKCNNRNNNNNIDMVRIERIGYKQNENREKSVKKHTTMLGKAQCIRMLK